MAARFDDPQQPDGFDAESFGGTSFGNENLGREEFTTDEGRVRARFWRKLRSVASRIPFAEDAAAAYYCALDSRTPAHVRAMTFGALAYFVLPADAIPDIFIGIGFTDDAAVLATALNMLAAHITPAHRTAARAALDRLKGR